MNDSPTRAARLPQPRMTIPTAAHGSAPIVIALCCIVIIAALVGGVGIPDGLVLRHIVQTLPLWVAIALGLRRSRTTAWVALPLFLFWLTVMTLIWLYLLGIAHILSGHFSPLEIATTIIVGLASLLGIAAFARFKSRMSPLAATISVHHICHHPIRLLPLQLSALNSPSLSS